MNDLYICFNNSNSKYKNKKTSFLEFYLGQTNNNILGMNMNQIENNVKKSFSSKIKTKSIVSLSKNKIEHKLKNSEHDDSNLLIKELNSDSLSKKSNEANHKFCKFLIDYKRNLQIFINKLKNNESKN